MFSYGMGIINTLVLRPRRLTFQRKQESCDFILSTFINRIAPLSVVVIVIVLMVIVFALFRSKQIRRISEHNDVQGAGQEREAGHGETLNDTPSQGRLFIIQALPSELNRTSEENRESLVFRVLSHGGTI